MTAKSEDVSQDDPTRAEDQLNRSTVDEDLHGSADDQSKSADNLGRSAEAMEQASEIMSAENGF